MYTSAPPNSCSASRNIMKELCEKTKHHHCWNRMSESTVHERERTACAIARRRYRHANSSIESRFVILRRSLQQCVMGTPKGASCTIAFDAALGQKVSRMIQMRIIIDKRCNVQQGRKRQNIGCHFLQKR